MKTPQSLKLSLRELFLLVALAAVGMGWWREYQFAAPMHEALAEMQNRSPKDPVGIGSALHPGVLFQVFALGKGRLETHTIELTMTPKASRVEAPIPMPDEK